jgi:antitoxin VapB
LIYPGFKAAARRRSAQPDRSPAARAIIFVFDNRFTSLPLLYIRNGKNLLIVKEDAMLRQIKEVDMKTTRVFKSGNSLAVRLPKEFSVKSKVFEILRRGDEIVLREPGKGLGRAFEVLAELPDDFFAEGRPDPLPQHREVL